MDDKRRIIIRNPQLRHVRNSLRRVIMLAVFRELRELRNEFYDIFDKEYDKNVKVFPEPVLKQLRKLSEQEDRLRTALDDSVIRCPICGSWERDVEYVSKFESWFCVNCAKDTY